MFAVKQFYFAPRRWQQRSRVRRHWMLRAARVPIFGAVIEPELHSVERFPGLSALEFGLLLERSHAGQYAEAEAPLRRALQISPHYGSGHFFLAIDFLMQGRFDEALVEANKETLDDGLLEASAAIYYALNRKADSDAFLARSIQRNADTWASAIAKVYAFRGENDKAMEWLNRAHEQRDEDLYFISGDPLLKNLEHDERYKEFLRRMNLADK